MTFQIGPLTVHVYGLILMTGALAATIYASVQARRDHEDPEFVWDAVAWVLVGGILGARLWHIFTPPPSSIAVGKTTAFYLTHPLDAIAIWEGGLGIPGAVIGGALAMYWSARRRGENFARWADITAPAIALGQAIGRWGNFVNQELYGAPTDLPWAITIDPRHRVAGFETFSSFHPLFLYESIWNLGNMLLLMWLGRQYAKRLRDGDLFLVYLIVYPIGRFLLEFLRLDSAELAGINANQTFMVVVVLASAAGLWLRHRGGFKSKAEVTAQKALARADSSTSDSSK